MTEGDSKKRQADANPSGESSCAQADMATPKPASLATWAEGRGGLASMPLGKRLAIMTRVCQLAGATHARGLVHGNLKPASILIGEKDGEDLPRLEESRAVDPPERMEGHAPTHVAPECQSGGGPTVRSDVFSLGVLLFQMAVGDLSAPMDSNWRRKVRDGILAEEIERATDAEPNRRHASASELADSLAGIEERRQAWRKSRRAAASKRFLHVAAAGMTLTACGLGFGWWKTQSSEKKALAAREEAERLVDLVLGDAYKELKDAGRLASLDQAVQKVSQYYVDLPSEARNARTIDQESRLLTRFAEIKRDKGEFSAAAELLRRAIDLRTRNVASSPDDAGKILLAEAREELGRVLTRLGRFVDAGEALRAGLFIREELRQAKPDDLARTDAVGNLRLNLAEVSERMGDRAQAAEHHRESVSLRGETLARSNEPKWRLAAAWANFQAGWFDVSRGETGPGEDRLALAEKIATEFLAEDRNSAPYQSCLASAKVGLGYAHAWRGRYQEAQERMEAGVALMRRLAESEPANMEWRTRLGAFLIAVGRKEHLAGRMPEARDAFRDARATLESAVAAHGEPRSASLRALAGGLHARFTVMTADQEGPAMEELPALLKEENVRVDDLLKRSPDEWHGRMAKAVLASAEGALLKHLGQKEPAAAKLREAVDLFRRGLEKSGRAVEFENDRADAERQLEEALAK